ncbi:MAG TPA: Crp/Fnr family transcriptional regulator [Acidobacteriaceae bacterium]|jgi:CRP/FNR family transcriptional regulator
MNKCLSCPNREKNGFCNLSEDAREFLIANSFVVEYPRGSVLFREGDIADTVHIVCSGKLKVSASSQEGRIMILRIAASGSVLGLSAALSEKTHETSVEALEPCRVRVMRTRVLQTLLRDHPHAAIGAARTLADEYRAAFEEARRIALPETPAGRVACLLLDWMASSERKGSTITLPLTHDEVASMTATTRETVTRTLSRFRKDGIIQAKGVSLTILQPNVLQQLSAC